MSFTRDVLNVPNESIFSMRFNERTITSNRHQVSYFDEGLPLTEPVILIHGFPFNKHMWESQLSVLKGKHRCIAYDVRGHGNSSAGESEFTIDLFADDLLALLDALKIEKAILCGLSMGGYIALHAIQKQPDRFARLVLIDTQCGADTPEGREKRMKTIAFIQKNGLQVYSEESLKNLFAPASLVAKKEAVLFIQNTILNTPAENICRTLQALANRKETCSYLPKIKSPVCIVVGKEDKITPPEVAQRMQSAIPGSQVHILEGAGHLTNLEAPEQFNAVIKKFLKSSDQ